LASAPRAEGSFGALLRARRHRGYLSQEQLAARAELSERTVCNLEAGRVRSPRNDTVRLLADALELPEQERESWFAAAQGANGWRAGPALPGARGRAQLPSDAPGRPPLTARGFDIGNESWCRRSVVTGFRAGVVCEFADRADPGQARPLSPGHVGCLFLVSIRHRDDALAAHAVVHRSTFDKLTSAR